MLNSEATSQSSSRRTEPVATVGTFVRALRLPFTLASVLPFVMGTFAAVPHYALRFWAGFFTVAAAHLSANLMNDYADAKSGVDALDMTPYGFFGGSKLIQQGVLSRRFYLVAAVLFAALGFCAALLLALLVGSFLPLAAYCAVLLLAWSYSEKPLQLSYRGAGEAVVFLIFGPAVVAAGYYLQDGSSLLRPLLLSLPFGFLTAAILVSNETPDASDDRTAGKMTCVVRIGPQNGFILYWLLLAGAYLSIAACIVLGQLGPTAAIAFLGIPFGWRAGCILREHYREKARLVVSSRITVLLHAATCIILILDVALWSA